MTLDQIGPTEWILLGVAIIFAFSLVGFFRTKKRGFGPHNTSTLIVLLVLFIAAIGFLTDKIGADDMTKLLFALIGFSAGLFTGSTAEKGTRDGPSEPET